MFKKMIFISLVFLCWQMNVFTADRGDVNRRFKEIITADLSLKKCQIQDCTGELSKRAREEDKCFYCLNCNQRYFLGIRSESNLRKYGIPSAIISIVGLTLWWKYPLIRKFLSR